MTIAILGIFDRVADGNGSVAAVRLMGNSATTIDHLERCMTSLVVFGDGERKPGLRCSAAVEGYATGEQLSLEGALFTVAHWLRGQGYTVRGVDGKPYPRRPPKGGA